MYCKSSKYQFCNLPKCSYPCTIKIFRLYGGCWPDRGPFHPDEDPWQGGRLAAPLVHRQEHLPRDGPEAERGVHLLPSHLERKMLGNEALESSIWLNWALITTACLFELRDRFHPGPTNKFSLSTQVLSTLKGFLLAVHIESLLQILTNGYVGGDHFSIWRFQLVSWTSLG